MLKKILLLFICYFLLNLIGAQNCDDPNSTFEFIGSQNTYFCEGINGIVTVDITVDQNNDPACIANMKLEWGDGTTEILPNNFFGNKTHVYNFPDSIACLLTPDDLNPEVKLTLYFNNGKLNKRTQSLAITPLPRAKFNISGSLCVGQTINFGNTGCWGDSFLWTYSNGMSSTGEDGQVVYAATGTYTTRLIATNECGSDTATVLINIRDRPDINALAATVPGGCVPFNTQISPTATGINMNGYKWTVIGSPNSCSSCAQFIPATGKDSIMPVIRFTEAGIYTIRLIGSNECGNDTATIQINAAAQPNMTVGFIPSGCNALTVNLNDQLLVYQGTISTYNWIFPAGASIASASSASPGNVTFTQSGTIIVELRGPCDTIIKQIPIVVNSQEPISFSGLPQSICVTSAPFNLSAMPVGGTFTGPGITNSVSGTFNPMLADTGTHIIAYQQGITGCESQGTITITVLPADMLTIGGDIQVCRNAAPIPLVANPMPGNWTGTGISGSDFLPGNALVGPNTITYSHTNPAGCTSARSRVITVVAVPVVQAPDTLFSCDIATPVNLSTLGGITFTPGLPTAGSIISWTGNGVDMAGLFTSPGIGTYQMSLNYSIPPLCDTTVSIKVVVAAFVAASAGPDTVLCGSQGTYNLAGFPAGGVWRNNVGAIVTPTITLSSLTPGDHVFSYTIQGSTPCESSDIVTITLVGGNAVNAGTDRYVCSTTTVLPLSVVPGLNWSGPSLNGSNIDISALVPGDYVYTLTDPGLPGACNNDKFTLTVSPPPSGNFTISQDTACVGKIITVIPTATSGVQYLINWGDGPPDNSLTHQYSLPGDYDITLTATTINPLTSQVLCTATSTRSIHIIEPILAGNIQFLMDTTSGCAVLTVHFTNISQAESGTYLWNFGNGQTFSGYSPPPVDFLQGAEDTIYTITLTVKNSCDSVTFSKQVNVFPMPSAKMGISYQQPCSGGILKASVLSTGNPANNTFYTTTGLVQPGSPAAPSWFQFFTDSLPKTVGIWLVTSNFCGMDTAYQEVIVNPSDVVAVIGLPDTTRLCAGSPFTLINYATSGAPVDWTFSNGNTYTGDTIQVIAANEGIYHITLKVFGCGFDSMTVPVYVRPLPTIMVSYDPQKCPHLPVDFKITSSAAAVLLKYGDGDSTLQKISQHLFPGPGLFLPAAQAVSEAGCIGQWDGQITILTPPIAAIAASDSVCMDEPVQFTGTANQNNVTCAWTFGDGNISDLCMPVHQYSNPGLFTAVLTVISSEGCIDTAAIPVYVRNRPDANFTYLIKEKCTPAVVAFSNTSTGATGLTWTLGDGATAATSQFDHTYHTGQLWPVQLIATNEGICSDTATQLVAVFQTPLLNLQTVVQCSVAEGVNLSIPTPAENFVAVSAPGYYQTGNYHTALLQNDYHIYIKTPEGCENDTTIVILPVNELYLQAEQDSFFLLLGDSVQLEANVNQTGVQFTWTPAIYLDDATVFNPASKPLRTIDYVVQGIDLMGCTKYDTVSVRVMIDRDSSLFIPNAFSPNDDGNNDIFYVRNLFNPSIKGLEMLKIFDKFGEKVFDIADLPGGEITPTENPFYGWDGTFRGEKAEMGTYYFQIKVAYVDGFIQLFKGTLILIR